MALTVTYPVKKSQSIISFPQGYHLIPSFSHFRVCFPETWIDSFLLVADIAFRIPVLYFRSTETIIFLLEGLGLKDERKRLAVWEELAQSCKPQTFYRGAVWDLLHQLTNEPALQTVLPSLLCGFLFTLLSCTLFAHQGASSSFRIVNSPFNHFRGSTLCLL